MADASVIAAGAAGGAALLGAALAADAVANKMQQAVNVWQSGPYNTVFFTKHVPVVLGGTHLGAMNPLVSYGSDTYSAEVAGLDSLVGEADVISMKAADIANKMFGLFRMPSIEGIPIMTDADSGSRDVDVSEEPLIVQADTPTTTYVTDNAVPHPAEFTVSGRLVSNATLLDNHLVVKPTLTLQKDHLDMLAQSRRPCMFKTYDNQFKLCLIKHFDWKWVHNEMNALTVNVTLTEYKPLVMNSDIVDKIIAMLTGR